MGVLYFLLQVRDGLCILWGDVRERADKSAVAAINRALPFTRMDGDPGMVGMRGTMLQDSAPCEFHAAKKRHQNRSYSFDAIWTERAAMPRMREKTAAAVESVNAYAAVLRRAERAERPRTSETAAITVIMAIAKTIPSHVPAVLDANIPPLLLKS